MKRYFFLLLFAASVLMGAQAENAVGLDLSLLKAYEDAHVTYKDANGNTISDVINWVGTEKGVNYIRVRLFVDPTSSYATVLAGGSSYTSQLGGSLSTVKILGKRIKDAGLNFLLDIHYSDGWADPGKQVMPYRWTSKCTTQAKLQDSVYQYTKDVLTALVNHGATPDMVQVGNEITYGMFYTSYNTPAGDYSSSLKYSSTAAGKAGIHCFVTYWNGDTGVADSYWTNLCNVLSRGCAAVREVCPKAKIMLHTERSAYTAYNASASGYTDYYLAEMFYKKMEEHSVDYDVIGLSYYPEDHGTLSDLNTILTALENRFCKEIMLAEYGYSNNWMSGDFSPNTIGYYRRDNSSYSCPLAQKELISALITQLKTHKKVTGMFYWFPEENEATSSGPYGNAWRNRGLWANENTNYASNITPTAYNQIAGRALPAFDVLADFQDDILPTFPVTFESGTTGSASTDISRAWCFGSQVVANNPTKSGINTSNKVMTVTNNWCNGCALYTWAVQLPSDLSPYDSIFFDIRPTSGTSYVTCQFDDAGWTKPYDNATVTDWTANAWNRVKIALPTLPAKHMYFGMWESGYSIDNITLHEAPIQYTITTAVEQGAAVGQVTGGGSYVSGAQVSLTATAVDDCYEFEKWKEDNGTANPRQITITGNATYTAVFKKKTYTITLQSGDTNKGTVD